jgi:hypothetical protein
MNKRILIVGFFTILLLIIPISTASNQDKCNDVTVNNPKISTYSEVIEKPGVESSGSAEIVYARISGSCNGYDYEWKSFFLIHDIKIYAGLQGTGISIDGWKRPLWDPNSAFSAETMYVHASHFVGYFQMVGSDVFIVTGFAFGYIEWS